MKNFIVRTITAVFFVAAVVSCFLRAEAMVLLFALVTGLTVWEFTGLVNDRDNITVNRMICTVAGVYFFFAMAGYNAGITAASIFIPYLVTLIYLLVAELYLKQEDPVNDWAYTMMSQLYIALPFSLLNVLAFRSVGSDITYSYLAPLAVFVFLWVNDAGAYICGSLLGKHKLFPRISPGKSWEGSIGGGILVMLVAVLIWHLTEQYGVNDLGLSAIEKSLQAHPRHQGQRQHLTRPRGHARSFRLIVARYSRCRRVSLYPRTVLAVKLSARGNYFFSS